MKYDPAMHHRRSIRLNGYDYSQAGLYFVTIVARDRACLFGGIVKSEMRLNDAGQMIAGRWQAIPGRFARVTIDSFVVMPNHIHGIVVIGDVGATLVVAPTTLGRIVGAFKSASTVEYARGVKGAGWPSCGTRLWQRNYHEHIVRTGKSLARIREYILMNAARWEHDRENPLATELEPEDAWLEGGSS